MLVLDCPHVVNVSQLWLTHAVCVYVCVYVCAYARVRLRVRRRLVGGGLVLHVYSRAVAILLFTDGLFPPIGWHPTVA